MRADEVERPMGSPPVEVAPPPRGGLRLVAAAVTLPWLLGYGVTGSWTVTRGARAAAAGLGSVDVGYSRAVSPAGLFLVGGLLFAAFAVLLATATLLLYGSRRRGTWAVVFVMAAVLLAGSVWAAARGGLQPGLWVLFFFGIAYVAMVSLVVLLRLAREPRRRRLASP